MTRLLSKLADWVSRLPQFQRRGPALERLHEEVLSAAWRVALIAMLLCTLFRVAMGWIAPHGWWGFVVSIPISVLFIFLLAAMVDYAASRAVRDYSLWSQGQARRRRRRAAEIASNQRRLPPVATATCMECHSQIGERHQPWCPTIPAGWFPLRGR